MNNDPTTEHDLRSALQTLIPEDLDVTGFRARLDHLLDAQPKPDPAAGHEVVVLPLDLEDVPRRSQRSRVLITFLAAGAAAAVAILLAVLPSHRDRAAPQPATIRTKLFPGTIVLQTYAGTGSRTIAVEPHTIPAHFGYSVYGNCTGTGSLTIGPGYDVDKCDGDRSTFGYGPGVINGRLVVTTSDRVRWKITLVIQPAVQSNGGVQFPVDDDMTGPDNGVRQSGSGTGTARFSGGSATSSPGTTYRLRLVCHGSGVALPDLKGDLANGLTTKTCFSGFEYVWNDVQLTVPTTAIRVVAAAGTTWTIAIDSF